MLSGERQGVEKATATSHRKVILEVPFPPSIYFKRTNQGTQMKHNPFKLLALFLTLDYITENFLIWPLWVFLPLFFLAFTVASWEAMKIVV